MAANPPLAVGGHTVKARTSSHHAVRLAQRDPAIVRNLLVISVVLLMSVLVILPVAMVFLEAFWKGPQVYFEKLFQDPDTLHSIQLTLTVAPIAVAANVLFGLAAARLIARFKFPGRSLLITVIDLPFAVSPVVAGLMFVMIFGRMGLLGPFLLPHGIKIINALPGLILVTTFVTLPFVVRELIPVMEAIGSEEEVAAVNLGANAWQIFWSITLPNIKWGLLYGIILCNARAMGEFGAVYVVSGRVSGQTLTMPLQVNFLYERGDMVGSYAVASLLTFLALISLAVKVWLERLTSMELADAARSQEGTQTP